MNKNKVPTFKSVQAVPDFNQNEDAPLFVLLRIATFPLRAPVKIAKALVEAVQSSPCNDQSFRDPQ